MTQQQPSQSPSTTLNEAVMRELQAGAELQSQTNSMAVLVIGRKVNHILHLILSLLTAGIWLVVWLLLVLTNKRHRVILTVNADGSLSRVVTTA